MTRRLRILIGLAALAIGLAALLKYANHRPIPSAPQMIEHERDSDWWPSPSSTTVRDATPILTKHCLTCHDSKTARGGIDLTASDDALRLKAANAIRSNAMPPPDQPRPSREERDALETFFDASSTLRVTVRRLNRTEYDNTIRDLLGIAIHPAADFPADDTGYGFDNNAAVLSLPPIMIEKYLAAAERAVAAALQGEASRQRLLNPRQSPVPIALRKVTLPERDHVRNRLILSRADLPPDDPNENERQRAYTILMAFADRAFRRPATHEEVNRLLRFVEESQRNGEGIEPGLRLAFQAILCSSQFLFRIEREANRIDNFELATRLAYFLWSSTPDDELFALAANGNLRQGNALANQVRRMLRDPKAQALASDFAGQWLQTRALQDYTPDAARFPQFDESLRRAMARETELFVDNVIREDRSVLDFLAADYTFVNERLAKHYGIANVQGDEFRRVSLAGTARGGVFTHASILAITSNPTRTSPVKRGRWILENLLGAAPPSPPPGSDQLTESQQTSLTMRQQMERHRSHPQCASCHAGMDPLGFGLEAFDAVGALRTRDGDSPLDASGVLPDGRAFVGPGGLQAVLLERRADFEKCLAEKLLTYALGRGLDSRDRQNVKDIVRKLADHEDRFSALVLAIVHSDSFLPRNPGAKP